MFIKFGEDHTIVIHVGPVNVIIVGPVKYVNEGWCPFFPMTVYNMKLIVMNLCLARQPDGVS